MNQKKVWFVIVTYRPEQEALRRLITAIHEWPTEIVDNTDKNLGYGGGANVGMKKAFDAGAEWLAVCNQDVTLSKQGVAKFVKALEHCKPGIVGPEAGTLDPKRWTTILKFHKVSPCSTARRDLEKPDYISGSMIAIHRNVYEVTGGFYEPYFMYYEDVDFCIRARNAGFALKHIAIDGFVHSPHGNAYYLARNHLLFVARLAPISVKLHELIRLPKTLWETLW